MDEYKLVYFPVRGRAQVTRYLLEDQNIRYEYVTIPMDENWVEYKPKTMFGKLPVLHHGEFELSESHAIVRYLATRHGLLGDSERDRALVDMIFSAAFDLYFSFGMLLYSKDDEYKAEQPKFVESLPEKLAPFEKLLKKNNDENGFFVGKKISIADYGVFDIVEILNRYEPGCLDSTPLLQAFHDRMMSRDGIKTFLASDDMKKWPVTASGRF